MSQPCRDHKPIFKKKCNNKTKWLSMVPNAWLTRRWCFFGHLNLIITFSMHNIRIPEFFISMKCCRSIGDQNCHSLGYGVEPSLCFYEKVHQVKLKYGSNHLAKKLGQKMDRVKSLLRLLPNTFRTVDVLVTSSFTLIQPHVLRKNSQYFICVSFTYIHAFH